MESHDIGKVDKCFEAGVDNLFQRHLYGLKSI